MFDLIGLAIIGGVAGYFAGYVMKGKGFGILGNIAVGVAGALLGGFLFGFLGALLAKLIVAFVGAVILLWLIDLYKRKK